jgi:hypothetical protein
MAAGRRFDGPAPKESSAAVLTSDTWTPREGLGHFGEVMRIYGLSTASGRERSGFGR